MEPNALQSILEVSPPILIVGLLAFAVFQALRLSVLKRLSEAPPWAQMGFLAVLSVLLAYAAGLVGFPVPAVGVYAAAVVVHRFWKAVPVSA